MDGALTRWEHARRLLPFGDVSEQEVYERLSDGRAHLWVTQNSAAVTEVTDDNLLHILTAGGVLRDVAAVLPDIHAFARAMGCLGIEAAGRSGWRRYLPRYGYVPEGQKMVLHL